jgi:type IV pilus assembly protein PilC
MATAAGVLKRDAIRESVFVWEGRDRAGKVIKGEMRAGGKNVVHAMLRRQGINVTKVRKQRLGGGKKITEKDIALFTRQMATMMKAGVPLLQSFDIVGKGHANPRVTKLLMDIRSDVETGSNLAAAFRKHPLYFDALFCNLVQAGEQAGILETLLDRLATYKEKMLAIKSKIKAALFYPTAIIVVAFVITAVIMIFVIPAFKQVFTNFGADLPAPTLLVMGISDFFVQYWYLIFGVVIGGVYGFFELWRRSLAVQIAIDRFMLKMPASGNYVYMHATKQIQQEVSTGTSLTAAMQNSNVFPNMVVQMTSIGEESGSLDSMLSKVADFFEQEVDDSVEALSSLMEPMIMVVLGVLIGGMVVAMYLPIFKLGQAI